ncbi:hypothetical protein [Mycobacterium sp. 852002-40037_SCH5390672]|uniref:hypothetical protein n=1 Tax=Mycobacterium sp. 852002-40037_SCH5390672 TaxID=1834089 RepID=UPI001E56D8E9|nr:hypothetical protein [Mycobacterium sp. 852002-40037_SCH5390672]
MRQRFSRAGRAASPFFAAARCWAVSTSGAGQAAFWSPIAGVSDDECDALVTGGPDDPRWSPAEPTLIEAVDELERTGSWSEATWSALGRRAVLAQSRMPVLQ